MARKPRKRLTSEEFDALLPYLGKFTKENIAAVRAVLVDDRMQKDVAAELDVSFKTVSVMVGTVWDRHIEHGSRPEGWEVVKLVLPPALAKVAKEMARTAHETRKVTP